ncbi:Serine/threonine protein kinase, partial [uncultured Rubrobacteraceae bacterium]
EGGPPRGHPEAPAARGGKHPRTGLRDSRAPAPEQQLRRLLRLQRGAGLPLHRQSTEAGPPRGCEGAPWSPPRRKAPWEAHPPAHRAALRDPRSAPAHPDSGDAHRGDALVHHRHKLPSAAALEPRQPRATPVLGHPLPPRPRHPSPGSETFEYRLRARDGEDPGPKHRQPRGTGREGRRHEAVHGPRAGPRRARRPRNRGVGHRGHPVRSSDRRDAVQRGVRDGHRGSHLDRYGSRRLRAGPAPGRTRPVPPACPFRLREHRGLLPGTRLSQTPDAGRSHQKPRSARV